MVPWRLLVNAGVAICMQCSVVCCVKKRHWGVKYLSL